MWVIPKTMKNDIPLLDNLAEVCTDNLMYRSKVSTLRAWNRRLKTKTYLTNNLENRIVLDDDFLKTYVKNIDASLKLDKAPLDLFLYIAPDQFIHLESWQTWVKFKRVEYKNRNIPSEKPMWATPTVYTENKESGQSYESLQRRVKLKKQIGIQGMITLDNGEYIGRLNPRWVETLMGLPVGWCMVTCKDKKHDQRHCN